MVSSIQAISNKPTFPVSEVDMSPYPVQTDRQTIVETAFELVVEEGVESLSLGKLASQLGIKASSLYRYIASKESLLQAVIELTYLRLFEAYDTVLESVSDDLADQLIRLSHAHRRFAQANLCSFEYS
jgi:AcrR family transcriptional regulator